MASSTSTALHTNAERVAEALRENVDGIEGVCLFGSVARGTARSESDIDLLVVGSDPTMTQSQLRRRLPDELGRMRMSLAYHTPDTLTRYLRRWSRFGAHLRREGEVLFDTSGALRRLLAEDVPISTQEELSAQRRHLDNFRHPGRFGDQFLFPLASLYRIGRTVVFALLAETGELSYDASVAFAHLGELYPDHRDEIETIQRLKPFYELVTGRGGAETLPFEPTGCSDEVVAARRAIDNLLSLSHAPEKAAA